MLRSRDGGRRSSTFNGMPSERRGRRARARFARQQVWLDGEPVTLSKKELRCWGGRSWPSPRPCSPGVTRMSGRGASGDPSCEHLTSALAAPGPKRSAPMRRVRTTG
jgi:hypothetical protein